MLTKNELKQLRSEITLNSLFLKDYENTLFIKPETVYNFFDSFLDYCYENENYMLSIGDFLEKHDNINELYDYYLIYESDPLIKDDFIAHLFLTLYDAVVIYEIDNDYVITAFYHRFSKHIIGETTSKLTKNKLYYNYAGDLYFIKNHRRYYINDFTRIDNNQYLNIKRF